MNRTTGQSELNAWRNSLKEMHITLNDSDIPKDAIVETYTGGANQRVVHPCYQAVPGKYKDFVDIRSQSEGWKVGGCFEHRPWRNSHLNL